MVKKLGLHRVIDSFFANYKLAVTKNIRSFIIPISSQTLPLVKSFYKANLLYSYTIDHFKNSIIVFPRPTPYIKTFQVMYTAHKSIISISQLQKYQNIGYEFLIFSPFNRGKFITSTEFTYLTVPGFLLAIWLQASEKTITVFFIL